MASAFKHKGKGDSWYAAWNDHNGQRRTKCTFTTDKEAAQRIAAKLEADAALRRDGVIDPHAESVSNHAQRTIEAHLTDFEAKMNAAKRTAGHVNKTLYCNRKIVAFAGFRLASEITADGVSRYAAERRKRWTLTGTCSLARKPKPSVNLGRCWALWMRFLRNHEAAPQAARRARNLATKIKVMRPVARLTTLRIPLNLALKPFQKRRYAK